ncbi:hypothetical protein SAMN04515647_0774 [Cohaesibacter sp. ES.047]|uniref:hypothetical protein n=1 Tax=Cohaesibacter sp. ES.047 TaxID=1798205 RepID=UPI000BB8D5F7|nr:hypothetical protein [Cohaesibacter sp. ES.047]SNY90603.1 hypothetical protein SAMN04515647_0774 [Cohaesibacter sp. ES.047]
MRSILPIVICLGCLLAITYPAFAMDKGKQPKTTIKRCIKADKQSCTQRAGQRKSRGQLYELGQIYELGLPKGNRDGRTRKRIKIK